MSATSATDLTPKLDAQRQAFRALPNPTSEKRKDDLKRLLTAVLNHQEQIVSAINDDFGGRSRQETVLTEIYTTVSAIRYARANLAGWMRPRRRIQQRL